MQFAEVIFTLYYFMKVSCNLCTPVISDVDRAAAKKEKKQGGGYSLGDGEMFGRLVRVVSGEGEWRECETCHKKSPVKKMLLNNPDLGR